jgi:hypothetical protein
METLCPASNEKLSNRGFLHRHQWILRANPLPPGPLFRQCPSGRAEGPRGPPRGPSTLTWRLRSPRLRPKEPRLGKGGQVLTNYSVTWEYLTVSSPLLRLHHVPVFQTKSQPGFLRHPCRPRGLFDAHNALSPLSYQLCATLLARAKH